MRICFNSQIKQEDNQRKSSDVSVNYTNNFFYIPKNPHFKQEQNHLVGLSSCLHSAICTKSVKRDSATVWFFISLSGESGRSRGIVSSLQNPERSLCVDHPQNDTCQKPRECTLICSVLPCYRIIVHCEFSVVVIDCTWKRREKCN